MTGAQGRRAALRAGLRRDEGTITILLVGVLVVVLMVIGVGVSITGVHLQRTELQDAADAAALAASQSVESQSFYGTGERLTAASARSSAEHHLSTYIHLTSGIDQARIEAVDVGSDGTVRLTLVGRAHPPLIGWLVDSGMEIPVTVVGEAHAR